MSSNEQWWDNSVDIISTFFSRGMTLDKWLHGQWYLRNRRYIIARVNLDNYPMQIRPYPSISDHILTISSKSDQIRTNPYQNRTPNSSGKNTNTSGNKIAILTEARKDTWRHIWISYKFVNGGQCEGGGVNHRTFREEAGFSHKKKEMQENFF